MNLIKKLFAFGLVLLSWNNISAQAGGDCNTSGIIFTRVEKSPQFGDSLQQYFERTIPNSFNSTGGGIVTTQVIDTFGNACCTQIEGCNSPSLARVLKKAIDKMTGWEPAIQNGRKVRFYERLLFDFTGEKFAVKIVPPGTVPSIGKN
jgi:hypothetical protein